MDVICLPFLFSRILLSSLYTITYSSINLQIIYIYKCIYMYVYIYIYMCVCVCVCVFIFIDKCCYEVTHLLWHIASDLCSWFCFTTPKWKNATFKVVWLKLWCFQNSHSTIGAVKLSVVDINDILTFNHAILVLQ